MGLVKMTTNLKSLRYGKDTLGGGNSNQPYIKSTIPDNISDVGRTGGPDFLLRGGTLLPKIIANDVSRMTQMFFDFKSPRGPLFIAKQNILSLTNVNSSAGYKPFQTTTNPGFFGAIGSFIRNNISINQGIYTPLSTIGQVAGNALGIHLNKQGLNPSLSTTIGSPDGNSLLGLPTYLNTITTGGTEGNKSRLEPLLDKINNKKGDNVLYTYSGGPGATLGVGRTNIVMLGDQRTGVNNNSNNTELQYTYRPNSPINLNTLVGDVTTTNIQLGPLFSNQNAEINSGKIKYKSSIYNPGQNKTKNISDIQSTYGASTMYFSTLLPTSQARYIGANNIFNNDGVTPIFPSVYQSGILLKSNNSKLTSGVGNILPPQVFTQEQVNETIPFSKNQNPGESLNSFLSKIAPSGSNQIPFPVDYTQKKIETRVNLGDPGKRGNLSSYTIGKRDYNIDPLSQNTTTDAITNNSGYKHALDKINALPIYQSKNASTDEVCNDLVKFRIGIISNTNPSNKTFIHFRAFIDSFDDNYSAEWNSTKYMGRGEKFYRYAGFDRNVNMSWTVAAQSKQELIPMWQKLNYLASACAPDYSTSGYMGGNLISLTVGGYLYEQVGIMTGLNISIPQESPWEISIPDGLQAEGGFRDPSVKEMPMMAKITGFNFIPIHDFVPKIQHNTFDGRNFGDGGNFVGKYGKERYISLSQNTSPESNNYGGNNINYIPIKP
jgi:hypothetical protein